jgi:hypothetical protein
MSIIRQRQKNLLMAWLLGVIMTGGIIFIVFVFCNVDINDVLDKGETQSQIQEVKKQQIYVAAKDIKRGKTIEKTDIKVTEYEEEQVPTYIVESTDQIIGKKALVDISIKTPLTKSIIYKEGKINKDLREQEFALIYLPSKLEKEQYVDVRISFPTGQDYIIISKKKVQDISRTELTSTIWLHLNEEERLTMNSAIVDAYLNEGTKIYSITYVEPQIQEKALVNYPVSNVVLDLMKTNPNILLEAERELSLRKRKDLDNALKALSGEDKKLVSRGEMNPIEEKLEKNVKNTNINETEEKDVKKSGQVGY